MFWLSNIKKLLFSQSLKKQKKIVFDILLEPFLSHLTKSVSLTIFKIPGHTVYV